MANRTKAAVRTKEALIVDSSAGANGFERTFTSSVDPVPQAHKGGNGSQPLIMSRDTAKDKRFISRHCHSYPVMCFRVRLQICQMAGNTKSVEKPLSSIFLEQWDALVPRMQVDSLTSKDACQTPP